MHTRTTQMVLSLATCKNVRREPERAVTHNDNNIQDHDVYFGDGMQVVASRDAVTFSFLPSFPKNNLSSLRYSIFCNARQRSHNHPSAAANPTGSATSINHNTLHVRVPFDSRDHSDTSAPVDQLNAHAHLATSPHHQWTHMASHVTESQAIMYARRFSYLLSAARVDKAEQIPEQHEGVVGANVSIGSTGIARATVSSSSQDEGEELNDAHVGSSQPASHAVSQESSTGMAEARTRQVSNPPFPVLSTNSAASQEMWPSISVERLVQLCVLNRKELESAAKAVAMPEEVS
jgi:hypothetical protein